MAVFPDRIVLKNTTTTSDATIISEIETGGTNEIVPGELVVKRESGSSKLFTKDASGAIVTVGGAGPINDLTDVDTATVAPVVGDGLKWDGVNWVPGSDINTATPATLGQVLGWDGSSWIPFNSFGTYSDTYQETTSNLASHPLHGPDAFYADQAALEADGFTFIASNIVVASPIPTFNPGPSWDGIDFLGNGITSGGSWYISCQAGVGWDNSFDKTNANYGVEFYTFNIDFHVALWATASSLRLAGYKEITAEGKDWLCVRMDYAIPSGDASAGMPTEVWFAKDGSVSIRYGNAINGGSFSAVGNPDNDSAIASNGTILTSDPYTNISYSGDYVFNILQTVPRNDFLGNLGDVTLTALANGDRIEWNGTQWVNVAGGGGVAVLNDLTDVTITAAGAGEVLRYDGAAWVDAQLDYADLANAPVNVSAFANDSGYLTDVVLDATPQLGGNLDVNGNYIVSTANGNVSIAPNGTGLLEVRGNTNDGSIKLNCSANTHGVTIKSPPHAAAATYTLVLPTSAGTNGQVLTTDGTGVLSWGAGGGGAGALNDLTDVTITAAAGGEVLRYSGTAWVDAQLNSSDLNNDAGFISGITAEPIGDLSDVVLTSPTNGQYLQYNGTNWINVNAGGGGGATQLNELSDVTITAAVTGEVLRYNGSAWVDVQLAYTDLSGTPTNLSDFANDVGFITDITGEALGDLSNVAIPSPTTGDVLSYNGTNWVNTAAPPADISGSSINGLNDVDTATSPPANGEGLIWNSTSGNWEPGAVSAGPIAIDDLTDVDTATNPPATGQVLKWDGSNWVPSDDLQDGSSGGTILIQLDSEGSGDLPVSLSATGMTSTYPSTDAYFGSGGATFLRSNADFLSGTWVSTIGTNRWTLSFWIKTTDTDYAVQTGRRILAPQGGTNLADGFQIMRESAGGATYTPHADNLQGAITLTPGGVLSSYLCSTRTTQIADGSWHYIVMQHEGSGTYSCFVDGALTERRTAAAAIDFADNSGFFIGKREDNNADAYLTGSIDNMVMTLGSALWLGSTTDVPTSPDPQPAIGESIDSLNDVDTATNPPSTGQVLEWDGANWVPATLAAGGVTSIIAGTGISVDQATGDVTITATGGGGATAIDDLTDVDTTTAAPSVGQVLKWDGSNWIPGNDNTGGGGSATLGRGDGGDLDFETVDSAFVFAVYGGGDLDTIAEDKPVEFVSYDVDGGELT